MARELHHQFHTLYRYLYSKKLGLTHIKARVKHSQSYGKVERAEQTIEQLRKHFLNLDDTVYY